MAKKKKKLQATSKNTVAKKQEPKQPLNKEAVQIKRNTEIQNVNKELPKLIPEKKLTLEDYGYTGIFFLVYYGLFGILVILPTLCGNFLIPIAVLGIVDFLFMVYYLTCIIADLFGIQVV